MPNTKSAAKELRKSKKLSAINLVQKKRIKDLAKKIHKALNAGKADEAQQIAKDMIRMLDKAAKNKIFHKNAAARKKSRIMKAINKKK